MSASHPNEILLVDDSPQDRELTLRALRKNNLANEVTVATDGAEALDYLLSQGRFKESERRRPPALILLDLKLPKVDGLEVLERVRADQHTRSTPVVILTSSNEERDVARAYDLGANSYIVKPVEFETFTKAVQEVGSYWLLLNKGPR